MSMTKVDWAFLHQGDCIYFKGVEDGWTKFFGPYFITDHENKILENLDGAKIEVPLGNENQYYIDWPS
jgi:hypothetical protein